MEEKWYNKTWFIWLMLIIFSPVGIFLIWKNKRFSPKTRKILTGVFAVWFLICLAGTLGDNKEVSNQENKITATEVKESNIKKDFSEKVKTHVDGTSYLKSSSMNSNIARLEYNYSNSDEQAKKYFETGDKINKILMETPFRILRYYPEAKSVSIVIRSDDKISSIDITRDQIESFIGFKIDTIKNNDDWREKISNKFFVKNTRNEFITKYVRLK